ncbi:MAG: HNH endonuclease [Bacteroidales bacterium]|nr:HNH endonuclease [Bacteroidales bacterium]
MVSIDDYIEVKDCIYKDEHYSVRDNGAIMRHHCNDKPIRKNDNVWSFGKPNILTGYMDFCGERVHRIVATAFHGPARSPQHVVDHIDTNRQNNRPENLHWVTKLENSLNNPITRAKIEYICGSIEAFLENPTLLYGHESEDKNFHWMRNVTPEEARVSYENFLRWAKQHPESKGGTLGEWVYKEQKSSDDSINSKPKEELVSSNNTKPQGDNQREYIVQYTLKNPNDLEMIESEEEEQEEYYVTESLTPNCAQVNWRTPSEFPCCPQVITNHPIEDYIINLKPGAWFCKNKYYNVLVIKAAIVDEDKSLVVLTKNADEHAVKQWGLSKIIFDDGVFYHISKGTYFHEDGAQKYYTIAQGKEWTGGDVFDDFC